MPPEHLPRRLLVVEDNAAAREGLAAALRGAGYEVLLASDGQEALALLAAGPPPDLILLDMLMPVLDGWHFLEQLRKQGGQPPVPIVIKVEALLDEIRRCLGRQ